MDKEENYFNRLAKEAAGLADRSEGYGKLLYGFHRQLERDSLITGYCNISRDVILDVSDQSEHHLLGRFGFKRDDFFRGIAGFIVDTEKRREFMDTFLTDPLKKAYLNGKHQHWMECYVKLPQESRGRNVIFNVTVITSPLSRELIGFLAVKDLTNQTLCSREISRQERAGQLFAI